MNDQLLQPNDRRFAWVTERQNVGPRLPFDVDLCESPAAAVTPTVGAISAAWILVVPRTPAICIADLPSIDRRTIMRLVGDVRDRMEVFGDEPFLFEHGARTSGSKTGCGVDQAHLHIVRLNFDLLQSALLDDAMIWRSINSRDPWSEIEADREYYLVSDFFRSFVAYPAVQQSQYFRRLIAYGLRRADEWDYRLFENEQNASETVRRFGSNAERRAA